MLGRVLSLSLALCAISLSVLALNVESERLQLLSAELQIQTSQKTGVFLEQARSTASRHEDDCRTDFRRTATAIALADLRQAARTTSERQAILDAGAAIGRQLACSPADGSAWLLRAVVADYAGQRDVAVSALTNSYRYAPREGWIMQRRLEFACDMSGPTLDAIRGSLIKDFKTLLLSRQFKSIDEHANRCWSRMEPLFASALGGVPKDILADYASAGAAQLYLYPEK